MVYTFACTYVYSLIVCLMSKCCVNFNINMNIWIWKVSFKYHLRLTISCKTREIRLRPGFHPDPGGELRRLSFSSPYPLFSCPSPEPSHVLKMKRRLRRLFALYLLLNTDRVTSIRPITFMVRMRHQISRTAYESRKSQLD